MKPVNCVKSSAVGLTVTAFIRKDWTVSCVGTDYEGHDMNSIDPIAGSPGFEGKPEGEFWMVDCGNNFCVAISRTDRSIYQWGATEYGSMPACPSTGRYKKVAANGVVALALDDEGHLSLWGHSNVDNSRIFTEFAGVNNTLVYTDIAVGRYHCMALLGTGHVISWGGESAESDYLVEPVHGSDPITAIAAGERFSLAIKTADSGTTLISSGSAMPAGQPTDPVDNEFTWDKISAYYLNAMALRSDGTAAAWGSDLGLHRNNTGQSTIPYGHNTGIKDIAVGYSSSTIVKHTGGALSWGEANNANLVTWHNKCFKYCTAMDVFGGFATSSILLIKTDGTILFNSASEDYLPKPLPRLYGDYVKVSGGEKYALCLKSDGSVIATGSNDYDECNVPADTLFKDIAAGNGLSVGLDMSGNIIAWGTFLPDVKTAAEALTGPFTKVCQTCLSAGVALHEDGHLEQFYAPGAPDLGLTVPAGTNFTDIACGLEYNAIALKSDKTVSVWGSDLGAEYNYLSPPPVNEGIIAIAAGANICIVLYENNTIYVWGYTTMPYGLDALNGDTALNKDIIKIGARGSTVVVIKKDLTAYAFGSNLYYECNVGI